MPSRNKIQTTCASGVYGRCVVGRSPTLTGLDELLIRVPNTAGLTSSTVLITGPSRTGDIEQILVRGVHGPGEMYVVVV
jgi:L-lactate dehydrogenase complex protein LldG